MKRIIQIITLMVFVAGNITYAQEEKISLSSEGFIPVWSVVGPFEQPMVGFGVPVDEDVINEKKIEPRYGKTENSILVKGGSVRWIPQSTSTDGFLDFNKTLRWISPGSSPKKIWYAITGYAAAYIHSDTDKRAVIKYGSNSFGKILVNNQEVFSSDQTANAVPDNSTIQIDLKKGKNLILVKTGNSHKNHGLNFFEMIKWEWGFFLRLLDETGNTLKGVQVILPDEVDPEFNIISTFFFKKADEILNQRLDIELISAAPEVQNAKLSLDGNSFDLDSVVYGLNRFSIYVPEITSEKKVSASVSFNGRTLSKKVTLFPAKHYELHVMLLSHTDIGYTHPQPVVKEIHTSVLDEVVEMCENYSTFKWTIETLWQLEQYELSRSPQQFAKVIELIKKGRISVSPLYANPFTGWIGEEEMFRSLDLAKSYKERYGLNYNAAVYNDLPGQSWLLPQVLRNAGVKFLAEGINEIFNDYSFQRSLPKAFVWEGSDGSRVLTYRNEGYGEGRDYGLEGRGNYTVQQRMWELLNKLTEQGYDYELVLLNTAFMDNSIVPKDQFLGIEVWNKEYEFPKFISSNLSEFADLFAERYEEELPTLRGDWTSTWDSHTQGEPERMQKQRLIQHSLLSAEKISTLTSILDKGNKSFSSYIDEAYNSLLQFSGHGSGLEYGYGSPADNLITMEFRQDYINNAFMKTEEVLKRGIFRISRPQESFDSEGIIIFNTLSWKRDATVEVQFPAESMQDYQVIDLESKETVPSFREGYTLYFIARDLPSFGYKKFSLVPGKNNSKESYSGLATSSSVIENQFYKISTDYLRVNSIIDKKSGKELIDKNSSYGFNTPLIKKSPEKDYSQINHKQEIINIKDESPVRVILQIIRPGELFEKTEYILWNNIDRVDVEHLLYPGRLDSTEKLEQYSIAFPYEISDKQIIMETSGGFLDPEKDKLPGTSADVFSIRRTASSYNSEQSISLTSIDARVMEVKDRTIISNVLNNFPLEWNRYEGNIEKLLLRYSFTNQEGSFNPSYSSKFGWSLNTPPVMQRSWYREEPTSKNYLNIDNEDILLLSLPSLNNEDGFVIRLMNVNGDKTNEAVITSKLFAGYNAFIMNYFEEDSEPLQIEGDSIRVSLRQNEIKTIKLINISSKTSKN